MSFVWWSLQVRPDPRPLPISLIVVDSPQGQSLLESAEGIADYQRLLESFQEQSLVSFCGVASGVTVLNALGNDFDQKSFFTDEASQVRSRLRVMFGGMSTIDSATGKTRGFVEIAAQH